MDAVGLWGVKELDVVFIVAHSDLLVILLRRHFLFIELSEARVNLRVHLVDLDARLIHLNRLGVLVGTVEGVGCAYHGLIVLREAPKHDLELLKGALIVEVIEVNRREVKARLIHAWIELNGLLKVLYRDGKALDLVIGEAEVRVSAGVLDVVADGLLEHELSEVIVLIFEIEQTEVNDRGHVLRLDREDLLDVLEAGLKVALSEVRGREVVHRGEVTLLREQHRLKLLDRGVGLTAQEQGAAVGELDLVVGDPAIDQLFVGACGVFIAPEALLGVGEVKARDDVIGLGELYADLSALIGELGAQGRVGLQLGVVLFEFLLVIGDRGLVSLELLLVGLILGEVRLASLVIAA